MNRNYLIILLISSALLSLESKKFNYSNKQFYQRRAKLKISVPNCKSIACKLELAINTGVKKIPRSEILIYKKLNLIHLFTPSGLHLVPISFLARAFLNKYIHILIIFFGYLLLLGTNNLMSLERIFSLKLFYLFLKNLNCSITSVFLIAMICNLLTGNFETSTLSFVFSFLFLGSVISGENIKEISLNLYISNLLISYFFIGTVNFIAPIFGIIISSIFTFLYPFLFLNFWIGKMLLGYHNDFIMDLFHQSVKSLYLLSTTLPDIELSLGIIFIILLSRSNKKAFLLLILICFDLNQHQIHARSKTFYKRVDISR